jgi:HEAT repeat protein
VQSVPSGQKSADQISAAKADRATEALAVFPDANVSISKDSIPVKTDSLAPLLEEVAANGFSDKAAWIIAKIAREKSIPLDTLAKMIRSGTMTQRETAARILMKIGTPDAVRGVLDVLSADKDLYAVETLTRTFQGLNNQESWPVLASFMTNSHNGVIVYEVQRALSRTASEDSIATLCSMLTSPLENWQEVNILTVLEELKTPKAVEPLHTLLLQSSDEDIIASGALGLKSIGTAEAVSVAANLIDQKNILAPDHPLVSVISENRSAKAFPELANLLQTATNPIVKYAAATALAEAQGYLGSTNLEVLIRRHSTATGSR